MKTLDEVIKGFQCCQEINCAECPYANWDNTDVARCNDTEKEDDALHYLWEYREKQRGYEIALEQLLEEMDNYQTAVRNCEDVCLKAEMVVKDAERNDPLSWDELKAMKGKPVWIEHDGFTPQWELVTRIGKVHFYAVDAVFFETEYDIDKYGTTWQAYRKERE